MQCYCCRSGSEERLFCQICVQRGLDQQRALKSSLTDQTNIITRRCLVQDQAAATWRILRAEVAAQERRVGELRARLAASTAKREVTRSAPSTSDPLAELRVRIEGVKSKQRLVDHRITAARRVLVLEAAAILGLEPGRIAGLALPGPREMKLQEATRINAALLHICHLLDLLTRYLFIALPFEPGLNKGKLSLRPNLPFVGTTKFRDKNILSLGRRHQRLFFTSYALLSHSIAYLAWMQGVEEGEDAGLLSLLHTLVHSTSIGAKSHLGTRSLAFSLDVNDVVERVLEECGLEEEGWSLVNA